METFNNLALELGAVSAVLIPSRQVFFDKRVLLKCRWGCGYNGREESVRCGSRGLSFEDCREIVHAYGKVLLVRSHEVHELSKILLEVERQAFLAGHYLAFSLRTCHLCKKCAADAGQDCVNPWQVRPCDQAFGIDMFRTAREAGLPCQPLQDKDDVQNRYGLVLLA